MTAMDAKQALVTAKDWLVIASSLVTLFITVGGGLAWVTGGFRPQTQVDYQNLSGKVDTLQKSISDLSTLVANQPSPRDFAAQESHLAHLDATLAELGNRLQVDEVGVAVDHSQMQRLIEGTQAPVRQPR